jgi:hypothetical protein
MLACTACLQYEGEIHVTIIATGFSQTFEENLWGGKSSTVSSTGSRGSTSGTSSYRTLEWPRDPPVQQQQAPLLQQQQQRGPGRDALSGNGWGAAPPRGGRPDRRGW